MPGSDASAGVLLPRRRPELALASTSSYSPTRLKIPGPRDSAMRSYCEWQCL
ncbi:hypothetical protein K456DRAFT_59057 [Colletotrichum gloeosporioides 23]|nr:hypothetical protein K456DRAFT_59057 [Colletotrichum gloeosporioides 23]